MVVSIMVNSTSGKRIESRLVDGVQFKTKLRRPHLESVIYGKM